MNNFNSIFSWLYIWIIMFLPSIVLAQTVTITGQNPAIVGNTYTYTATRSSGAWPSVSTNWTVYEGTIISKSIDPADKRLAYVSVRWDAMRPSDDDVINLHITDGSVAGNMLITVNCNSITNPTYTISPNGGVGCGPTAFTISASSTSGTVVRWYTSGATTPFQTGSAYTTPTLTTNTNYLIEAYNSTSRCTSAKTTIPITFPAVPATPTAPTYVFESQICGTSGSAQITAQPTGTGTTVRWYTAATGGTLLQQGNLFNTPTLSTQTTYYITSYNTNTCGTESSPRTAVVVNINPIPTAPTAASQLYCSPTNVTLSGTLGANGTRLDWSNANNTFLASGSTYAAGTISATTIFNARSVNPTTTCVSTPTTVTVTISPLPSAPSVVSQPAVCGATSISLSGSPGANGNAIYWYSPSDSYLGSGSPHALGVVSTSGTYYARTVNTNATSIASCTSTPTNIPITINPIPSKPTIGSNLTYCGTTSNVPLSATSAGNTLNWYNSSTNALVGTGNPYNVPSVAATTSYYTKATNTYNCTSVASSNLTVTINSVPGIPTVANLTYCGPASNVSLSAGNATGNTVNWYNSTTNALVGTGNPYIVSSITATTGYYAKAVNASNCTSAPSGTLTVTINPIPSTPSVGANQTFCGSASNVQLSATSAGNTVNWYNSTTNALVGTGNPLTGLTISSTTSYYAKATNTYNCVSGASPSTTVTINPVPSAPVVGSNQAYCGTQTNVSLSATATGNTVNWYNNITNALVGTGNPYIVSSVSATTSYYAKATNASNCTSVSSALLTITINAIPVAPVVSNQSFCGPASVTLSGTVGANGTAINWYNSSGALLSTLNPYAIGTLTSTTIYTAKSYNASTNCISGATSVTVSIYTVPTVQLQGSSVLVPGGGGATLSTASGSYSYQWLKDGSPITGNTTSLFVADPGAYAVSTKTTASALSCTSAPVTITTSARNATSCLLNYIVSTGMQVSGVTSTSNLYALNPSEMTQSIQYFDGLGRPVQTVDLRGTPSGKDLIHPVVYDAFGRESRKYLPLPAGEGTGSFKTLSFNSNGDYSDAYYRNSLGDNRPFSETTFENSPLTRATKDLGPGEDWFTADKATTHHYLVNQHGNTGETEKIIAWTISSAKMPVRSLQISNVIEAGGYYADGQLTITSSKDEQGNEIHEYTTKEGNVILKKVQAVAGTPSLTDINAWAQTYYIYDDFHNLRFVLQPELSKAILVDNSTNPSDVQLRALAFIYRYDARHRNIVKRVPGADSVFMVYDKRDRLVMTQDGEQRLKNQWTYTKYDVLNRPIMTGIYTHTASISQEAMTSLLSTTVFSETFNGNASTHGYTNNVFASANFNQAAFDVLTVTYYDNYNFKTLIADSRFDYQSDYSNQYKDSNGTSFQLVKGQVTGTKTKILLQGTYLYSVNYFDDKYRTVQNIASNIKGGVDRTTSVYDFVKVLKTKTTQVIGSTTRSFATRYDYDFAGRILNTWHSVNGNAEVLLDAVQYNELSQVAAKKLYSTNAGLSFTQTVDNNYNIRGWLSMINDPTATSSTDLFSMKLNYTEPSSVGGAPQYNGNISEMLWNTAGQGQKSYGYSYDALNRLGEAKYYNNADPTENGRYNEKIGTLSGTNNGYDLNGNILALIRYGKTAVNSYGLMDNLTYTYPSFGGGNQLRKIDDAIYTNAAEEGFKESYGAVQDYDYNQNGAMTYDLNKDIRSITYNHLNLPEKVTKVSYDYILYTYDATGRKLRQEVYSPSNVLKKQTDYLGSFFFENDTLKFINHDEGRVVMTGTTPEYQYFLKDHLGNVRLTFTTQTTPETYSAGFESAGQAAESTKFLNYPSGGYINTQPTNAHTGTNSQYLSAGYHGQVGVAKSFSVMPGDQVQISSYVKFNSASSTTGNLSGFAAELLAAFGLSAPVAGESATPASALNTWGAAAAGGYADGGNDPVKLFVNILVFDRAHNFLDIAYKAATTSGAQISASYQVKEPGYVYVYISNEQGTLTDSYFDDVTISFTPSVVVQVQDYYPFGLTFNSFQRESTMKNCYLYNQGVADTKFLTERIFDLDLNIDQSKYRVYDPATGRWLQVDPKADKDELTALTPYNYSYNNPIRYNDPEGDFCPWCVGALVGAAVDTGLQLAEIALDDKKTLSDFSVKSVLVSAAAGAVGVGIATKVDKALKVAKIASKAANAAIKLAAGAATDAATSATSQAVVDGKVDGTKVLADVVAGGVAGKFAGDIAEKVIKNSPTAKVLTKQADRAQRIAGAGGRSSRQQTAQKLQQKADNYVASKGVAAGVVGSGTASTIVKSFIPDQKSNKITNQ